MLIERGFMTVLRSSGAPCEATLVVILKLLNVRKCLVAQWLYHFA